ncbi:MAG: hydratase [Clostridia bacterium]|nr:hydratase [Clostridia bacterium]
MKLYSGGVYLVGDTLIRKTAGYENRLTQAGVTNAEKENAKRGTMAYSVLQAHNTSGDENTLRLKFDAIASHDITYVGIIQTAKASGLTEFPLSYTLTNCHNSLCAVGGTINEDDHVFGLSAAKKYGGDYVPAHLAVIHQYMRERKAACGRMILGSDSHTRYGALGTMAIGEGGPELVKQLLSRTYDMKYPEVVCVKLKGKPRFGVGPQDVAIALIGATFKTGFVKNKVLEFVGSGIQNLSMDFRNGIDVMTTETTCLSSIWETDEKVQEYYTVHGRSGDYQKMAPGRVAYYDAAIEIDLSKIVPMIALPFHPSNAYAITDFLANAKDILREAEVQGQKLLKNGKFSLLDKVDEKGNVHVSQGIIAGCAGGMYENIALASNLLAGKTVGSGEFTLSVYPSSQPVYKSLADNGYISSLMESGAIVKTAFCGPCFGAGDVPSNNGLSIRHTTRNFEMREGSKPGQGQLASVALMDARSIAATAANGGILTPATEMEKPTARIKKYTYNGKIYEGRVYYGFGNADSSVELRYGPNIADWPEQPELKDNLLLSVASSLNDAVTTTDDLIPSGDTSSYRSNPKKLASFTLSKKDPEYVAKAEEAQAENVAFVKGENEELNALCEKLNVNPATVTYGSVVASVKPGDGSAREQAASCQRVLGGSANICVEYATKRYRSNLINWGMMPFLYKENCFSVGDKVFVPNVRERLLGGETEFPAKLISEGKVKDITLTIDKLTDDEKQIIADGCLINFYKRG